MTKTNLTDEVTAILEEIVEEDTEKKPVKGEIVLPLTETEFMIGSRQYKLISNYREGFNAERLGERYSEVLARYDYIVGDWGYEQLRLKGFFDSNNRKATPDQRIDMLQDYLYEYCNFGCAYFVIQRVGGKREKTNPRRRKKRPATNQAHIEEKKEVVANQKKKPVMKQRPDAKEKTKASQGTREQAGKPLKDSREKPVMKQRQEANGQRPTKVLKEKKGFTIRKREE
jgi:Uncharacterized protein conserved in bacteria